MISLRQYRVRPLAVFVDACIVINAYTLASLVLFARWAPLKYYDELLIFLPLAVVIHCCVNLRLGLYRNVRRYAGLHQGLKLSRSAIVSAPMLLLAGILAMPSSYTHVVAMVPIGGVVAFIMMSLVRFYPRIYFEHSRQEIKPEINLLVVGAGVAGEMIVSSIKKERHLAMKVVALVDDDPKLWGLEIHGVAIHGPAEKIPELVNSLHATEILIAMPSASLEQFQRIFGFCSSTGLVSKTVRPLQSIHAGKVGLEQIEDIEIQDLLGRQPVETDYSNIRQMIQGKVVLITGAGGSIGSELAQQISRHNPSLLVLTDRDESALYDIHERLSQNLLLSHDVSVMDVQLKAAVESVFRRYRPEIVFHAAAYKHVPLMELQPEEAILNNVKGTWVVAHLSGEYGASCFVNISTDKAVEPVNVMGATKQLGEKVVNALARSHPHTNFCTVRFGNVLDSRGSVIPIFRRQIRNGGPVTITHPEMTRYFMLISEAVDLVLQAAAFDDENAVYVLEMGKPVKIMDLASQMISFIGEGRKIDIVYTGLRPGEKVHEKLMAISESCEPSDHPMISRLKGARANDEILASLPQLFDYAMNREREDLVSLMKQLTDSYSPFDLSRTGGLEDGCDTARATGPTLLIQAGVSYKWSREAAGGKLNA